MLHRLTIDCSCPCLTSEIVADGIADNTMKELLPVWRGKIVGSGTFCIVRSILIVGWHFDYPIKTLHEAADLARCLEVNRNQQSGWPNQLQVA